ncbi:hypothetical protein EDB84DRAFT_930600 [Lactarius hengduanensis]|nr:hypothetical protein EDB84DRAFT_930600 [Lactarius hengduanensis]
MPSETPFKLVLDAALTDYINQVGIDLATYPLADSLRSCASPDDVLKLLEDNANKFKDFRDGNRKLLNWLSPLVQTVHTLSTVLGASIALVPFEPAKAVFAGVDVLIAVLIPLHYPITSPYHIWIHRQPVASARATMRSLTCLNALEISSNAFGSAPISP